jgi:cation diffusion facilitator CzcD-associated flavoprotein CzcO
MLVRSDWRGSHIADPQRRLTLDRYEAEHGAKLPRPRLRRDDFVAYGLWYQRRALPAVDERRVTRLETDKAGFRLTLSDGDVVKAERVVVATGLMSFASRPPAPEASFQLEKSNDFNARYPHHRSKCAQ